MDIFGRPQDNNVKTDGNIAPVDMCIGTKNDRITYVMANSVKRIKIEDGEPIEMDDIKITGTYEGPIPGFPEVTFIPSIATPTIILAKDTRYHIEIGPDPPVFGCLYITNGPSPSETQVYNRADYDCRICKEPSQGNMRFKHQNGQATWTDENYPNYFTLSRHTSCTIRHFGANQFTIDSHRSGFANPDDLAATQAYVTDTVAIEASSTWLTGGIISINGTDELDVTAGTGVLVINGVRTPISWDAVIGMTGITGTLAASYVYVDASEEVKIAAFPITNEFYYSNVVLGFSIHPGLVVIAEVNQQTPATKNLGSQVHDLSTSVGNINVSGNVYFYSGLGAANEVDVTAGRVYEFGVSAKTTPTAPNFKDQIAVVAATLRHVTHDFQATDETGIDTTQYEPDGLGVLVAVDSKRYYVLRFWRTSLDTHLVQYGQHEYKTREDALTGIITDSYDSIALPSGILRSTLIIKGTDDFTDADFVFIEAGKFGMGATGGSSSSTSSLQTAYNNGNEIVTDSLPVIISGTDGIQVGATGGSSALVVSGSNTIDSVVDMPNFDGKMVVEVKRSAVVNSASQTAIAFGETLILVNSTTNANDILLPDLTATDATHGYRITVCDVFNNASVNNITFAAAVGNTIDTPLTINTDNGSVVIWAGNGTDTFYKIG